MADTKAANLRLESKAYSTLHYLATIEGRSKADIVEEALNDYLVAHPDRLASYAREVAALAGLTIRGGLRPSRTRAEVLRSHGRKGLVKA
jgi:predicted DNA-binding protein